MGIDFQSKPEHFVRAALESVAYQTRAILEEMFGHTNLAIDSLKANGGMSANKWLMQFLADQLNIPVYCYKNVEATTLGILHLLYHQMGEKNVWDRIAEEPQESFQPEGDSVTRDMWYQSFAKAVDNITWRVNHE